MPHFLTSGLTLAAGVALLASCGPSYYLSLHPKQPTDLWVDSRPTVRQQQDSIDVRLCFVRYEGSRLVFDADFRNLSRRPLTVGAGLFAYQPVLTAPSAGVGTRQYDNVPAIDPEPQLQGLSSQLEETSKQAANVSTGEVLTGISHLVDDLASLKKKETAKQEEERLARQQSEKDGYARQRLEAAVAAGQLRDQLQEMAGNALRMHTVEPGERKHGYVYFPRFDTADLLRVKVGLREQELTFDFTQTHTPR